MAPSVRYHSLAKHLTLQNLFMIAASLIVAGILSYTLFWTMMMQRLESSSLLHATQLASQIEVMLVFEDKKSVEKELRYHADYRPTSNILVFNTNGDLFAEWPEASTPNSTISPNPPETMPLLQRDGKQLSIWVPIMANDRREGILYIHELLDQEYAWLSRFLMGQFALILLVFIAAAFWLWHTNRRAFRPLGALTKLATEVSDTRNFKLRATVYKQDDIGRLSTYFNELLKRLEFWQQDLHQQLATQQAHGEAMQALAHSDELTGINNRLTFNQHLGKQVSFSLEQQQTTALLFIDLDKFKYVNDTFGHKAGDLVLQEVAKRIQECIRQQDDCYRLGGDEFAVLMRAIPSALAAEHVASRILQSIGQPILYQQQEMPIGCSIGIALCPDNASEATQLLEQADHAMYQAKHSGRNCYVRYGGMT